MYFPLLHPITNNRQPEEHHQVVTHEPQSISVEGSEFLDDALSDLKKRGYDADLNFETKTFALYGGDLDMRLNPEGYHVDEIDRTRDEAHPNNNAVVYAITSATGIKGVLVDTSAEASRG